MIAMLFVLINIAIGLVAAGVLVSLVQSGRQFLPVWRKLQSELAALEEHSTVRVSIRDFGGSGVMGVALAPAPVWTPAPVLSLAPQPVRPAARPYPRVAA
jgi:hypothetical protein